MKSVTQRFSLSLCTLVLVILLAACGGTGGATTSTPTPTPTPQPPAPTPTPAVVMQTYTGTHFSISYPTGITESASGNQATFVDPVGKNIMTIITLANPGGALTASTIADQTMPAFNQSLLKNGKTATIAPTASVGGDTWVQRSSTGELAITDPGVQGTMVALFDTHTVGGTSMIFEIVYYGPTATFEQANTLAYQPMLQTFKFIG